MDINISNLIQRLTDSGLKQTEIGRETGYSQSAISELKNRKWGDKNPSNRLVEGLTRLAVKQGLRIEQKEDSPRRRKTDQVQS